MLLNNIHHAPPKNVTISIISYITRVKNEQTLVIFAAKNSEEL